MPRGHCRTLPRWQLQDMVPSEQLRQGAYKMQLRQREEAELELVRCWPTAAAASAALLACAVSGYAACTTSVAACPAALMLAWEAVATV